MSKLIIRVGINNGVGWDELWFCGVFQVATIFHKNVVSFSTTFGFANLIFCPKK